MLRDEGFAFTKEDPCIFIRINLVILVYVNDLVILYKKEYVNEVKALIVNIFVKLKVKDFGDLSLYLGIIVTRDRTRRRS